MPSPSLCTDGNGPRVPFPVLEGALRTLSHLILTTTLRGRRYHKPHFTHEETAVEQLTKWKRPEIAPLLYQS